MAEHVDLTAGARWRRRATLLVVALVVAVVPAVAGPGAPAEAGDQELGLSTFAAIAVDPVSGRVFVAGDDRVVALTPDGAVIGTVGAVYGAGGLSFDGGFLWVTQTTSGSIAKINPATLAKVGEFSTGGPVAPSIATVGGKVWFVTDGAGSYRTQLRSLDPATGAVADRGSVVGTVLVEIPGSTSSLLIHDQGTSPYSVYRTDLSTNPPTQVADVDHGVGSNLRQIATTDVGTFIAASGAPYRFDEFSTEPSGGVLRQTGVVYPASNYPNGVAYSAGRGGVVAGTTQSTRKLFVAARGIPRSTHVITLPGEPPAGGVALSTDAGRAYAVSESAGGFRLSTYSLAPTRSAVDVPPVKAGVPTRGTVTGTGLGSIRSATLGGVAVDVAGTGTTSLTLDIRTTLPPGDHPLVLSGPFGTLTATLAVVARSTGTVRGRVVRAGVPVADALVTLGSDVAAAPRAVRSGADGTWEISQVPEGVNQDLAVSHGGQTVPFADLALLGSGPWTYDVDLAAPPARGLQRRSVPLPPGEVRRAVMDPAGRTFVAVGDEVAVFDQSGRPLRRIRDQWSVSDLQVSGSKLYAFLHRAGKISEIDLGSLAVTRTLPVAGATTGSFAVGGGRIRLVDGDDQWTSLSALDLATGVLTATPTPSVYEPTLVAVDGSPTRFLSWEPSSGQQLANWDGTAVGPVQDAIGVGSGTDHVASAQADRVWGTSGRELALSTMKPTGVQYPALASAKAAARSGGHGGVLALGGRVFRQGIPVTTHELPALPAPRASVLDAAGGRSVVATSAGLLVTSDLAPVVNRINPVDVPEQPANVVVEGVGLGGATSVTVGGVPAVFSPADAGRLNVAVPALPQGVHQVVVTTPWGTSSPRALALGVEPVPTVTAASAAGGPATGGSRLTLTGTGLGGTTSVTVGGRAATSVTVVSSDRVDVTVPAHPAGVAVVRLTTGGGTATGPTYRYADPRPINFPTRIESQVLGGAYRTVAGDFDGDGTDDLLLYQPGAGADEIRSYRGDGTYTSKAITVNGTYQPFAGDFTGDGADDVFWYAPGATPDSIWDFEQGGGWTSSPRNVGATYRPVVGDFSGDGGDDVFWYAPGAAPDSTWDFAADGSVTSKARSVHATYRPFTGDFTGDGVDDVFWYAPGAAADPVWDFDAGGGFTSSNKAVNATYQPLAGDFTGDGLDDIVWYVPGPAADPLWDIKPGGWFTSASVNAAMTASPVVADLTGGGIDDVFWYGAGSAPDSTWFFSATVR